MQVPTIQALQSCAINTNFAPNALQPCAAAALSAALCAALVASPANAAYLDTDIADAVAARQAAAMRLADASYPLLNSAANSKAFPAFTLQWEALVSQEKLASPLAVTVDAASDVLLSLPVDKVKRAFESVPGDACERIPVPSTLLKSIAQARGPNPTKVQAAAKQLEGVKGSASGRSSDDTICSLPRAALEDFALAVDLTAAQRLDESWVALKAALKFKDASEVATLERDLFTQSGSGMEREAFKKATAQYRAARIAEADLLAKRAAGPPKCFTIGCNVNYDYDLWRSNSKDDYVGEGLERRQAAILSPKGISKEDLEKRAADFAAGNM